MNISKELSEKVSGRQKFTYNNQVIYEWDQNLEEINIYIQPPKYVLPKYAEETRKQLKNGQQLPKLDVKINAQHVKVSIVGNDRAYIDEDLENKCTVSESFWMIEDEELHINLQKMYKGEVWNGVFKNHNKLDPLTKEEVQKKILLERFQEEHPGFDFSGAEFNGMAPDPRKFMGGISYK